MKCSNCGIEIKDRNASICPNCGELIERHGLFNFNNNSKIKYENKINNTREIKKNINYNKTDNRIKSRSKTKKDKKFGCSVFLIIILFYVISALASCSSDIKEIYNEAKNVIGLRKDNHINNSNNAFSQCDDIDNNNSNSIDSNNNYYQNYVNNQEEYKDEGFFNGYHFKLKENDFALPCDYSNLESKTNLKYSEDDNEITISPGDFDIISLYENGNIDKFYGISVLVYNDSEISKNVKDCKILEIGQSYNYLSTKDFNDYIIEYPFGIKVGDNKTVDELENIVGQPTYIESYKDSSENEYKYIYYSENKDENYTLNNMVISTTNDAITNISMNNGEFY